MSHLRLISYIVAWLSCPLAVTTVVAQTQAELSPLPQYALEIQHASGGCSYSLLKGPAYKTDIAFTVSQHTPARLENLNQPPATMVELAARRDGDVWRVALSVKWGMYYDAGAQSVTTYTLHTDEQVLTARALTRFRVRPFGLRIVKVAAEAMRVPQTTNQTQSILVEKFETETLPAPYRMSLKNLANKHVLALELNALKGEQEIWLKWPEGRQWQPLIEAGGVHLEELPSHDQTCSAVDGVFHSLQSDRIDITTAVFADGSYEGKPKLAALIRARALGQKKQLGRALALLDSFSERLSSPPAEIAGQLREQVATLDELPEPDTATILQSAFPSLDQAGIAHATGHATYGMHEVKSELLADALALARTIDKGQEAKAAQVWFARVKSKYEGWVAATQAITDH